MNEQSLEAQSEEKKGMEGFGLVTLLLAIGMLLLYFSAGGGDSKQFLEKASNSIQNLTQTIRETGNEPTPQPTPAEIGSTATPTPEAEGEFAQCGCPKTYSPVCGSDGNTYYNGCMARCRGKEIANAENCVKPWITPVPTPNPSSTPTPTPLPSTTPTPNPSPTISPTPSPTPTPTPSPTPSPTPTPTASPTPQADFTFGWYTMVETGSFANLSAIASAGGSNTVIAYSWPAECGGWGPTVNHSCWRNYLDAAQARGIKVWAEVPRNLVNAQNFTGLRQFAQGLRGHPALAAYYLSDEPDQAFWQNDPRFSPQNMTLAYQVLKQEDPQTLVTHVVVQVGFGVYPQLDCSAYGDPSKHHLGCHKPYGQNTAIYNASTCGERDLCNLAYYEPSADILSTDYYPFEYGLEGQTIKNVTVYPYWPFDRTKKWSEYAKARGKNYVAIVQGTYWLDRLISMTPEQLELHPTKQEYRFYSIGNMLEGATGIIAFVAYRSSQNVRNNIIAPAYSDIQSYKKLFYDGIAASCVPAQECAEVIAKTTQDGTDGTLIGALNANFTTQRTITLALPAPVTSVKLFENGVLQDYPGLISINGNAITIRLEPQQAVLLKAS